MKKPNHAPEIIEIKGRKFHILPESPSDKDTAWTLMEEVNGQLVDPTDIMGCAGSKGFVEFHVRSSLR